MEILKLKGNEKKLYELVAPLVMSPLILRQNNNYPFKTAPNYIWHLLIQDQSVVGFIPLRPIRNGFIIDNYYFRNDEENIIQLLLQSVIESEDFYEITALVHKRNVEMFSKFGFITFIEWTKYDKMAFKKIQK